MSITIRCTAMILCMVSAGLVFGAGQAASESSGQEIPDVYMFSPSNKQGSTEEAYKAVQDIVTERIGIRPHAIYVPAQQQQEKLALLLAGGDRLDIFKGGWTVYRAQNVIIPINDLLDQYGPEIKAWLRPSLWPTVTDAEGNIWGIPNNTSRTANNIWLREDWLKNYGLQIPKTIDELEKIIRLFKEEDPAGGGNTIPLMADDGFNMSLAAGFLEGGWPNYYDERSGKIRHSVEDPGYKEFLTLMHDWYRKGYINQDFWNIKMADMRAHVVNGVVAGSMAWYSAITHTASAQLAAKNPEARYVMVPEIRGPKGLAETASPQNTGAAIFVAAKSTEKVAAMQFLNFAYSGYDAYALLRFGIEGKDFEWGVREPDYAIINELNTTGTSPYQGEFSFATSLSMTSLSDRFHLGSDNPVLKMIYDYINQREQFAGNGLFAFQRTKTQALHNTVID